MAAELSIILAIVSALITTGLFLYGLWVLERGPLQALFDRERHFEKHPAHPLKLSRAKNNPLLPVSRNMWEAGGVMNPGAVRTNDKTHLFYRALGADGASRIGYASSADGVHVDERLPYPVYVGGEGRDPQREAFMRHHHPALVASGGSWSGTEDPRAVVIEDKLYLSFNAFEGWHSLRMGVVSLSLSDLEKKIWNWSKVSYLSPKNQVHKNWVLFPEKIKNMFAVLHSVHGESPDEVRVEYFEDIERHNADKNTFYSPDPKQTESREISWHERMRGAGPPPIKTDKGWLVLYHATDKKESHLYKLGAMLLDKTDPTKVIARSNKPVLEPEAYYENHGAKGGVVYACGATVENDKLTVYYGGADSVVCAAATSLSAFLDKFVYVSTHALAPVPVTA